MNRALAVAALLLVTGGWLLDRSAGWRRHPGVVDVVRADRRIPAPAELRPPTSGTAVASRGACAPEPLAATRPGLLASLRCVARTAEGEPALSGVVLLRRGAHPIGRAAVGPGGEARFSGLVPGDYTAELEEGSLGPGLLASRHRDSGSTRVPVRIARGARASVAIDVVGGASVQGFVVDAAGVPVSGATLRLQSTDPAFPAEAARAASGTDGFYELLDVLPGEYRFHVEWPPACESAPPAPYVRELLAHAVHRMDVRGESGTRAIRGRLVDAAGDGLGGVAVLGELDVGEPGRPTAWSLFLARAVTDAEGRFELGRLPPAPVAVRAAPRSGTSRGFLARRSRFRETAVGAFDLAVMQAPVDAGTTLVPPAHVAE